MIVDFHKHPDVIASAKRAGLVDDPDALKLIDLSGIAMRGDGGVMVPPSVWQRARAAKPHLFGGRKHASELTDAEFQTARKARAWRR